jgi:hypothetical protein
LLEALDRQSVPLKQPNQEININPPVMHHSSVYLNVEFKAMWVFNQT